MTTESAKPVAVAAPPKLERRPPSRVGPAALLGGAALSFAILYAIDPAKHALYPTCWFYATTGWQCPGCGGLRATHQFLHGRLAAAWTLNPLAVLLAPVFAWVLLHAVLRVLGRRGLPGAAPRPAVLWLGLAGLLAFTVLRNLPWR